MAALDTPIMAILRDVLCASISLDDGLSALQGIVRTRPEEVDLAYEVARAIEEIILRRPALASAKLTELTVRLSFSENRVLPKMLMLLETRYTNSYRRNEAELLPDKEAIPRLLDILGELAQSMGTALDLNLRPLLPFLADETLLVLDAIRDRGHEPSIRLALHEVHYLTTLLLENGLFECAEALLGRLVKISGQLGLTELEFEVSLDEAAVLTELGLYEECRELLQPLIDRATKDKDTVKLAALTLQLSVNETRDDAVHYLTARSLSDRATSLYSDAVVAGLIEKDELGAAYLTIASSILSTGWRESVKEALSRFRSALDVLEDIPDRSPDQSLMLFKCFAGLGFAHGLLGDHDNTQRAIEYMNRAMSIVADLEDCGRDSRIEQSRCDNALGWICLVSESDEFWDIGIAAFERAIRVRRSLLKEGRISTIELLGSQLGLGLSQLRSSDSVDASLYSTLRETLLQYVPLFPTDDRAFVEVAIAVYDIVWMTHRHGVTLPERILRLFDDIVKMLDETPTHEAMPFIVGPKMIVPYLERNWEQLERVTREIAQSETALSPVAHLMSALATAKRNQEALASGLFIEIRNPIDDKVIDADPLLAQYWKGQVALGAAIHSYYSNRNFQTLAARLYDAAVELRAVEIISADFLEAAEFIRATAQSLSVVLFRFVHALEALFGTDIESPHAHTSEEFEDAEQFGLILTEDWIGLIKITMAYLQMIEQSENIQAQPYLNAVFSNISRALRMMDAVALVERRILALLGEQMNRRYYMRR
ncbi:MAG TPA: hypothetical protein ENG31_00630 [Candidatus Thorarchaeota archaeon]|nr:MAG: hypothetical protein DRO73_02610 [Candidatus Thorarchaeota archaeon]HDD67111.1 hypothetical protein [Candidatus Thorarchaeota archaeon]